jgi:hypothetical protein
MSSYHQRDRLRGVEVEIGIAQAADVEAREGAAEGGFDQQAGQAAGQEADVLAAGADDVELLGGHRGDGDRHFLDVFLAPLRGDGDQRGTAMQGHDDVSSDSGAMLLAGRVLDFCYAITTECARARYRARVKLQRPEALRCP